MVRLRDQTLRPISRMDWSVFRAVSLVLLIVFLGVLSPITGPSSIQLPSAKLAVQLPGAAREDALLIAVTRDGKIFLARDQTNAAHLSESLRSQVARGSEKRVYITADARARYGAVAAVIDASRAAGIEQVSFITFMPPSIRNSR